MTDNQDEKITIRSDVPLSKTNSVHVDDPTHAMIERMKKRLKKGRVGRVTKCDAIKYVFKFYEENNGEERQMATDDTDLDDKLPCVHRFDHRGWFWCGRNAPQRHKLHTLKQCKGCRNRLDEEAFLKMQQELQKQNIQALQLSINSTIQKHKDQLYPTCDPLERQGQYGYEIQSDKCPNDRVKNQWHPPDICPLNCPFLKRVQMKKKKVKQ